MNVQIRETTANAQTQRLVSVGSGSLPWRETPKGVPPDAISAGTSMTVRLSVEHAQAEPSVEIRTDAASLAARRRWADPLRDWIGVIKDADPRGSVTVDEGIYGGRIHG